jgi:hypothetical protein
MDLASAAVPDCWALANPAFHNSTNVANANANKFLLMAFSLTGGPLPDRRFFVQRVISEFPAFVYRPTRWFCLFLAASLHSGFLIKMIAEFRQLSLIGAKDGGSTKQQRNLLVSVPTVFAEVLGTARLQFMRLRTAAWRDVRRVRRNL